MHDAKTVFTIGYSGFPNPKDFLQCLKDNGIRLLIDVRSSPFSAYYQQYDKPAISALLKANGIQYRHFAREFGARQESEEFYRNGRLDFELFAKSVQFAEGVEKIKWALERSYSPVLMCAEKEPSTCHRTIMVARRFHEMGFPICHLMPDGKTKTQQDIETELLETYFKNRNQVSLFEEYKSDDVLIPEAYKMRNDEIGYREELPV